MTSSPASGSSGKPAQLPLLGFVLLAALTLFWGLNWPTMKIVLSELPVWWFRSLCLIVGGGGLMAIALLSGQALKVPRSQLRPLLICALFNVVGWHLCSAYGLANMPAGRAAIIAFTMPVWASLLGSLLLNERLTRAKVIGLGLGLAGLAVLIGPDLLVFHSAPLGAFFMLLAGLSWAIGTVFFKRYSWSLPTITLVGWQLVAGALPVTIGAVILEPFPDLADLSAPALGGLVYVFLFPMLFCQWAYFKTVRLFPAGIAAIGTLAIPIVGVYSSAVILDEPVGLQEITALLFICAALASVLVVPALRARS